MSNYKRKDTFYKKAKEEGFNSRAAFKLKEINKDFRVLSKGDTVLELGAFPGGWTQVALEVAGTSGKVVALDLKAIEPLNLKDKSLEDSLCFFIGDIYEESTRERLNLELSAGCDVILSDMSPKLSGVAFRDVFESSELVRVGLDMAHAYLKKNGNFVAKIFPGPEEVELFNEMKKLFKSVKRKSLKSTRLTSKEHYLVCIGFL